MQCVNKTLNEIPRALLFSPLTTDEDLQWSECLWPSQTQALETQHSKWWLSGGDEIMWVELPWMGSVPDRLNSRGPSLSQYQSLFKWVNSFREVAKVLEFQLQHHSLQINPRADLLQNGLVGSPCSPRDSQESSPTPQFKGINSSALSLLHSPSHTHTWPQEKP